MRRAWGAGEFSRLANASLGELDPARQTAIRLALDEETCRYLETAPLNTLDRAQALLVVDALGRRALSEVYRQVLLGVITELWVDYLTQMEALRVSIGLEAYAQRDPLVQYKSKASALFQDLLSAMRLGVITRMFTYRPRDLSSVQSELKRTGSGVDEKAARLRRRRRSRAIAQKKPLKPRKMALTRTSRPVEEREEGLTRSQKRRRRRH